VIHPVQTIDRYGLDMASNVKSYPGDQAGPISLRMLADQYRRAAAILRDSGQRSHPMSWAPFRLSAVQAIELYLTAFLLHRGYSAIEIRRMGHDLGLRANAAATAGLQLRKRTHEHLVSLSASREYLITRYCPDGLETASQINRLAATLAEVTHKTSAVGTSSPSQSSIDR
jgi:hypothetical protein